MSKIMSASSQNVAVEEQHQSQAPGSQQEIIEPNMNASSDESDDGCSGAKVGTVGLVGLIAGGVLGYVGHCKYENYQHQKAVDTYMKVEAQEKADAEAAEQAEQTDENSEDMNGSEKEPSKKSSVVASSMGSKKGSEATESAGAEEEEENKVSFDVNNEEYQFCRILADMTPEEEEKEEENAEEEEGSMQSGSQKSKSKLPSASKKVSQSATGSNKSGSEVAEEGDEEVVAPLEKDPQYVNLREYSLKTKEIEALKTEHEEALVEKDTQKATEIEALIAEKTSEIEALKASVEAESKKVSDAKDQLKTESNKAKALKEEVDDLKNTVAGSSKKYRALSKNMQKVCDADQVPSLESLKLLRNERVQALEVAIEVYNLSIPQQDDEVAKDEDIDIKDLKVSQHNTADFQKSLKKHICNSTFTVGDEKDAYTAKIDALNENLATTKAVIGGTHSTVFKFLVDNNRKALEKENANVDSLTANKTKLEDLKKGDLLQQGAEGIRKNIKNVLGRIKNLTEFFNPTVEAAEAA